MDPESAATLEFRRAAVRMVAAAEYFKASGDLPPWARAELDSWNDGADAGAQARNAPPDPAAGGPPTAPDAMSRAIRASS